MKLKIENNSITFKVDLKEFEEVIKQKPLIIALNLNQKEPYIFFIEYIKNQKLKALQIQNYIGIQFGEFDQKEILKKGPSKRGVKVPSEKLNIFLQINRLSLKSKNLLRKPL